MSKDRRALVLASSAYNGIDFVEVVDPSESALRVHFLNGRPLQGTITGARITGGETIGTVVVKPINDASDWGEDSTHIVLNLNVEAPGDFSNYTLTLVQAGTIPKDRARLDAYFGSVDFSFKAGCPSDLDCQSPPVACPSTLSSGPAIDYLAKDFLSFRQALLDFSALNYPEWQERSEADFGVMFLEALCSIADDLSYTQDRIAAEAMLGTATQRRSVVRLARLVDYEPGQATSATVLLQFDVKKDATQIIDGTVVVAPGPDGTPIPFETGPGLAQRLIKPSTSLPIQLQAGPATAVSPFWNRGVIRPYWFDDSQRCLPIGSTQMYVLGAGFNFSRNQLLLIETQAATSADPPIRQIVQLVDVLSTELCDPLYAPPDLSGSTVGPPPTLFCPGSPPQGTAVTLIVWQPEDSLTSSRDLTLTTLAGNLVSATQGLTQQGEVFAIPNPPAAPRNDVLPAVVRTGPNDTPGTPSLQFLYTLSAAPLAWLPATDPTEPAVPELLLAGQSDIQDDYALWTYQRMLLDATAVDQAFTIDPARYSKVAGRSGATLRYDYDGDAGDTLRFGDGVFGELPSPGSTFAVVYRVGGGAVSNVAADTITSFDHTKVDAIRVSNPFPASGGVDAESLDSVRRLAPQAFRAVQYRAVIPIDYQAAAQTLPWVQRAGSVFRWTGSWLTVFTTPDPLLTELPSTEERLELIELLNRYRMAGYESYVPDPEYVSLDLVVTVCAQASAFQGDVETAVLKALGTAPGGFFAHRNFTFGQVLERSALEAAVQGAVGVSGVTCVLYRIRGRTVAYSQMGDTVSAGADQILRCDNDPSQPEHGSLWVIIQGGK